MPPSKSTNRAELRAREERWALPVALATLASVILLVLAQFVSGISGDGAAEVLRSVDENSGSVTLSSLLQAAAFVLLALPLVYLFRAAAARSDRVRSQLLGLVIAGPLFLALAAGFTAAAQQEAADEFVAGDAKPTLTRQEAREDCEEEREDEDDGYLAEEYEPAKGESPLQACENRQLEDDAASNARTEASLAPISTGLGLAGALGLIVALFYTSLWAMRTGLLSRFWGSLGMATGIATVIGLIFFLLIWLVYVAFLVLGFVPGGKPPAWEKGEAVPWPTPGEKAAAELEPEDGWDEDDGELAGDGPPEGENDGPKRKRKRRE